MEYNEGSSNENRDVSDKKKYHDESDENSGGITGDDRDVNGCNVERSPEKVNQTGSNEGFMVEQRKRQRIEENSSFYYDNPDYRPPHFGSSQSDFRQSSESESNVEMECNEEDDLKKAKQCQWRNTWFYGIRSFDGRGFDKHRITLHAMEMYCTDQDKNLLRVLSSCSHLMTTMCKICIVRHFSCHQVRTATLVAM